MKSGCHEDTKYGLHRGALIRRFEDMFFNTQVVLNKLLFNI